MLFLFLVLLSFATIAGGVAWYFVAHEVGQRAPVATLWLAAGFGVIGAIAAALVELGCVPQDITVGQASIASMFGGAFLVAVIEEICKFVPLAVFLYKRRYFNEYADGVLYFAVAGLGFGLPENMLYTLQFGAKAGLARIVMTPLFHAATTGMVGYYLSRAKLARRPLWEVALALAAAVVVHGLYDFGLFFGAIIFVILSVMLTTAMTAGLFLFFMRATEQDKTLVSVASLPHFCRSCGWRNQRQLAICVACSRHV